MRDYVQILFQIKSNVHYSPEADHLRVSLFLGTEIVPLFQEKFDAPEAAGRLSKYTETQVYMGFVARRPPNRGVPRTSKFPHHHPKCRRGDALLALWVVYNVEFQTILGRHVLVVFLRSV